MPLEIISPKVAAYLDALVPGRHPVLAEMEDVAKRTDFPIIGPASGQLCYLLTRLTGARRVFELGSGFGYSTAWFARAVKENGGGIVHHVVWDDELSKKAQRYLGEMGLESLVEFHVSEAVAALRASNDSFDVIFNDIDKKGYPDSLPVIESRLRDGGLLIVDNLLWSGRIFDDGDRSPATEGVRAFTKAIVNSANWVASIIPIRDGVLVARYSAERVAPSH